MCSGRFMGKKGKKMNVKNKQTLEVFLKSICVTEVTGEVNLFEKATVKEFRHSAILHLLLDWRVNSVPVFLRSFLRRAFDNLDGWDLSADNIEILREEKIGIGQRAVDVLCIIGDRALIIENKCCNASDQVAQIDDYVKGVSKTWRLAKDRVSCLYLRPIDALQGPGEDSCSEQNRANVKVNSYRELIVPWLKEDVLPHLPYGSGIMVSSLRAYIDLLEGWFGERERDEIYIKRWIKEFSRCFCIDLNDEEQMYNMANKVLADLMQDDKGYEEVAAIVNYYYQRNPLLNPDSFAYELKWVLRNNPTVYGREAMHGTVDLGIFNSLSSLMWYEGDRFVRLERCIADAKGKQYGVRIHINCSQLARGMNGAEGCEEDWDIYGGEGGVGPEGIPDRETITLDVMVKCGEMLKKGSGGWSYWSLSPNSISELLSQKDGKELLWGIAQKVALFAKAFSDALLSHGYKEV